MKEKKLGAGILTCTIIHIVLYVFAIFGLAVSIIGKDFIEQTLTQSGQTDALAQISTLNIVISLVITSLLLISSILILCKKKIGVYSFFTLVVLNLIYGIITTGFKPLSLVGLILPALLGYFIYKKKFVFGFFDPEEDQSVIL